MSALELLEAQRATRFHVDVELFNEVEDAFKPSCEHSQHNSPGHEKWHGGETKLLIIQTHTCPHRSEFWVCDGFWSTVLSSLVTCVSCRTRLGENDYRILINLREV